MLTHFIAFAAGVIVATAVGFGEAAKVADKGVEQVQTIVKDTQ